MMGNATTNGWTVAEIDTLGRLIDSGLSAVQMTTRLRRSRESIAGKAWRMGWRIGVPRTQGQRDTWDRRAAHRDFSLPMRRVEAVNTTVYVRLDEDTHREVTALAKGRKTTRCAMLRDLIEWGLEAVQKDAAE